MIKHATKTENKKVIDKESGEILSDENTITKVKYESEPDFIKLYIKDMVRIVGLKGNANRVLMALLPYVNYKNEIALIPTYRKEICNILKIKPNSLSHIIMDLQRADILLNKGLNQWMINPNFFGKSQDNA
jgi:hypothetical protein